MNETEQWNSPIKMLLSSKLDTTPMGLRPYLLDLHAV